MAEKVTKNRNSKFQLRRSWICAVYFFLTCYTYNQAPADVRSTGAGIECLYCMSELPARRLCGGGLMISQASPSACLYACQVE